MPKRRTSTTAPPSANGIRPPEPAELPRLAVICQDFIQGEHGIRRTDRDYFSTYVNGLLRRPDALVRAAIEDGKPIGLCVAVISERYDRPGKVAMIVLNVLEKARRQRGWGGRMVELVEQWATAHEADEVWTTVPKGATTSLAAYGAMGFTEAEVLLRKAV